MLHANSPNPSAHSFYANGLCHRCSDVHSLTIRCAYGKTACQTLSFQSTAIRLQLFSSSVYDHRSFVSEHAVNNHSYTTIRISNLQSLIIGVRTYSQQSIDSNRPTRQHTFESHWSKDLQSTVIRFQLLDSIAHCQRSFESAWPLVSLLVIFDLCPPGGQGGSVGVRLVDCLSAAWRWLVVARTFKNSIKID